jgi:cytoskeleton protein RodZ
MSDLERSPSNGDISAGALLRQAREAAGLHVAALAVAMKVPVKKLEALEADRYGDLPDTTFTRALAASVCRTLKVDATPVLERLPQGRLPLLGRDDNGVNAPFRAPRSGSQPFFTDNLSRPAMVVGALLLLAALVVLLAPNLPSFSLPDAINPQAGVAQGAPDSVAVEVPTPVNSVAGDTATMTLTPSPGLSVVSSTPTVPSPTLVVTPTGAGGVDLANALVVFKAGQTDSWVQVTDAKGKNILRRNLQPGETVGAGGSPPLAVVVGRADAMEITVRGRAFDVKAVSRDNVAKFEVK